MSSQVFNFKWGLLNNKCSNEIKELFLEKKFTDVTLVTDDKISFPAHKFILSAHSSVFRDLLLNNPCPHPIIYLRGIPHYELLSILKLVYLGETEIAYNQIEHLLNITNNLQFNQMNQLLTRKQEKLNHETMVDSETIELHSNDKILNVTKIHYCTECELEVMSNLDWVNHRINNHIQNNQLNQLLTGKQQEENVQVLKTFVGNDLKEANNSVSYSLNSKKVQNCRECDLEFKSRSGLINHRMTKHEGVKYFCDDCDYWATTRGNVRRHHESIHEGVRYACNSCDYQATEKGHLKRHKNAKHDNVKEG